MKAHQAVCCLDSSSIPHDTGPLQYRDEIILGIPMGMELARLVYWEWGWE